MVGIAEVSAAMASLQAAKDLVAGMVSMRDTSKLNDLRINLQSAILEAQQGLFAAQQVNASSDQRISQLEQEIVQLKDWSEQAARYALVSVNSGAFVYMQQEGMRNGEPAHWLCANCFDAGKKSVLQRVPDEGRPRERLWRCPTCKSAVGVSYNTAPTYDAAAKD